MANKQIDPEVAKWISRMSIAEKNQSTAFSKFSAWFDDMYAVVNDKDFAVWRSKVYFPRLTSKLWQILPKLVMGNSGFRVSNKGDNRNLEGARSMEKLLDYQYDNPEFDEPMFKKLTDVLIDAMVTGKGMAYIPWTTKQKTVYNRTENFIDLDTGEVEPQLMLDKVKVKEFLVAYPDFVPVNIFNFFYSPSGTSLQTKHWLIVRDWKTVQELEDENKSKGGKFYQNLDKLKGLSAANKDAYYNNARNRLVNETDPIVADDTVGQVETWLCFERSTNEISVVCPDAGVVISKMKNPYWHGKYPFVDFEIKPRAHDFWGEGIFEVGKRLQAAVNNIFNHYLDDLNLSLDGLLLVEGSTTIYDYQVKPGGKIRYSGDKPEQLKIPEPNPNQLKVADEVLSRAIDDITISPYVAGTPSDLTDKTKGTMGGILALQRAADDLLGFMKNCFSSSKRQVGIMWMQNDQQFMDRITYIDDIVNGEMAQIEVDPARIQGEFELNVDDESAKPIDPETEKVTFYQTIDRILMLQKAANEQAMMEAQQNQVNPQTGQPMPPMEGKITLNFEEIIKETLKKAGLSNGDKIMSAPKVDVGMPMPPEMPMAPQTPMMEPPQEPGPPQLPNVPEKKGLLSRILGG